MKKRKKIASFLLLLLMIVNVFSAVVNDITYSQGRSYDVWCDGTLGLHTTGRPLVNGATNRHYKTDTTGTFTLPTTAGSNYKYKLNGWYDIYTKKFYKPGERIRLDRDTVFYAEWIQKDYNLNPNGQLVNNQPDTSSFVKTEVFDYNEIFNAKHGATLTNGKQNGTYIDRSSWGNDGKHDERWVDSNNNSFIFTNWYNHNLTYDNPRTLGFPRDLQNLKNKYDSSHGHDIYSDIVNSKNDQLIKDLFDPKNEPGKQYLGKGNKLFQYDTDGNATKDRYNGKFGKGYYYYDSDFNGADYNKDQQRFYVYKDKQYIQLQNLGGGPGGWINSGSQTPGFMPFEQGTVMEKSGQTNYWFGLKTEIDFFLPDNVGTNGGNCNKSEANKDMRFYFSGDDDVWVFVDDKKVLDLGGIHGRIAGDINFSTGEITYENADSPGTVLKKDTTLLKQIKNGEHKLTIYYLERGSSLSNCSIYFNLAPRYNLEIEKKDKDTGKHLNGAEFSVYLDENLTTPALFWDSQQAYKNKEPQKSTFVTKDGKINCYGLLAGRTYYIKETKSPSGYPSVSDKIIKLKLDATGNATLVDTDSDFCTLTSQGNANIKLLVNNKKPAETSVKVMKKWYDTDGSVLKKDIPEDAEVTLYRSVFENQGGGSGSGTRVPIRLSSQYFGASNGANSDTFPLTQGNHFNSTTAVVGGKLQLHINLEGQECGIYSVTANGKPIKMVSHGAKTSQNMYMYGSWGNYPYKEATFEVDKVTEGLDIKVTVIGYIKYQPGTGTPSLNHTIKSTFTTTAPESGSGSPIVPPTVKPEGAEKVTHDIHGKPIENPVKLNKGNGWQYEWKHLAVKNNEGKNYYYYVEEKPVPGFSVSYMGNGVLNGTIEVDNTKLREIVVVKKWCNQDGSEMSNDKIPVDKIKGILIQEDTSVNPKKTKEINFTLTKSIGWKARWNTEDLGEQKGHTYKYYVKEITVDGFKTTYENNNGVSEATEENPIVIKNTRDLFGIRLKKYGINNDLLEKAEFTIYSDSKCTKEILAYSNSELTGTKQSTFSTNNKGIIEIYGLKPGSYWIKETKAPKGYRLLEEPIQININETGDITLFKHGNNDNVKIEDDSIGKIISITDKLEKIKYPKTGGNGMQKYLILGLLLISGGFLTKKYLKNDLVQFK